MLEVKRLRSWRLRALRSAFGTSGARATSTWCAWSASAWRPFGSTSSTSRATRTDARQMRQAHALGALGTKAQFASWPIPPPHKHAGLQPKPASYFADDRAITTSVSRNVSEAFSVPASSVFPLLKPRNYSSSSVTLHRSMSSHKTDHHPRAPSLELAPAGDGASVS